jgi:hypothetical protein
MSGGIEDIHAAGEFNMLERPFVDVGHFFQH